MQHFEAATQVYRLAPISITSALAGQQNRTQRSIKVRRFSSKPDLEYDRSTALPTAWAKHLSAISRGVLVRSLAQVRKLVRNP